MTKEDHGRALRGRVRALVYGVAFGDALGAPVEKLSAGEIRSRYGRVTSLNTNWHRMNGPEAARGGRVRGNGIVTDDTLMTLSLMEVYAETRRHLDAWDMADGFVKQIAWTPRFIPELQRETVLIDRLFYPEKWIYQRLQLSGAEPRQGGIGNMVNCGAAMYIAPIGVVNACDPQGAYNEAVSFAAGHQQSFGLEAAGAMAAAVAAAFIPGATIESIVETVIGLSKDGTRGAIADIAEVARDQKRRGADHAALTEAFHAAIREYSPMGDDVTHSVEKAGRVSDAYQPSRLNSIEELPLALGFALFNDGAFRRSVEDGINSGRDTDSIGVMAGAILGALHGEGAIEADDLQLLDRANRLTLMESADRFAAAAAEIMTADARAASLRASQREALLNTQMAPSQAAE
jgi:ADP-ribosylglycohydrolase